MEEVRFGGLVVAVAVEGRIFVVGGRVVVVGGRVFVVGGNVVVVGGRVVVVVDEIPHVKVLAAISGVQLLKQVPNVSLNSVQFADVIQVNS